MLVILAGMDQKDSCSGMCKAGISGDSVEFPQLQFLAGRRRPFRSEDHRDFAIAVHGDRSSCCAGRAGSLPCRDAEAYSLGSACLADHRDFAVAVRAGRLMSLLCRSSWFPGAVVKETAEISQLLLLRNRWLPMVLAALRRGVGLMGIFKGPVHRYKAGGCVHRDTVPIINCT